MTPGNNDQFLVRIDDAKATRLAPFTPLLIVPTTSGTAATFATVATQKAMLIKRLVVCNTLTGSATVTIHAVPSGGAISAATAQIVSYPVAGFTAFDFAPLISGLYAAGTQFRVWASVTNSLTISGHYEDVF